MVRTVRRVQQKTVDFNGASYTLYVYYDEKTDSVCQRVAFTNEPGCTTMFDISLSNGSKHTYVYKDNSLTVATPDVSNTDKTGVTGFDGQELPKEYAGNTNLELKYDKKRCVRLHGGLGGCCAEGVRRQP